MIFTNPAIHACDRQTDGQTEFSLLYRVCITCSTVKNNIITVSNKVVRHLFAYLSMYK